MSERNNVVTASLAAGRTRATTRRLWQYDYGMLLRLEDIQLPESYEVHFSSGLSGSALTAMGDSQGVRIPDRLMAAGETVHAWLYLHTGEDDGETVCHITIPVFPRARPDGAVPSPEEQDAMTQAIAALNAGVQTAEQAAARAEAACGTIQALTDGIIDPEDIQPAISSASIALSAVWTGAGPYTQPVTVTGAAVTAGSKVDLQPTAAQIAALQAGGVTALVSENNNGAVTVYALGAAPAAAMTVQCTVTEVTR